MTTTDPNARLETTALAPRPAIDQADLARCRRLLAAGSKSFAAASRLLPRRTRDAAAVFYAFCRVADDAVDESEDPAAALAGLRVRLAAVYGGTADADPVDRALTAVVRAHDLPRAPFDALLEGFAWDAQGRRYETIGGVLSYAARVASAVGVVMTYIMGARDPHTLARACDLGAAMQLTNICRDVGEDARRGRLYLPESWLRAEGVDPDAWLADPLPDPGVARVVDRLLRLADELYARGLSGVEGLPRDCRRSIRAAGLIYADIGRVIRRNDLDSVTKRATTTALRKLWLLWRAHRWRDVAAPSVDAPPLAQTAFLVPTWSAGDTVGR